MMKYNYENETLVCSFPQKVSSTVCNVIEKELTQKIEDTNGPIIFDLEGVTYICSMFLGFCLKYYQLKTKEKFIIRNLTPEVKKVFMIAKFGDMLL